LRVALLYTGARINEVAQLKLNDIVQESGVWCIRIQKTSRPFHQARLMAALTEDGDSGSDSDRHPQPAPN